MKHLEYDSIYKTKTNEDFFAISTKTLPEGQPIENKSLIGVWVGSLQCYASPARMELRINRMDERWLVSCSITVGDGTTLFTSKINRFDVSERGLEFYIPYRTGVKGEMYRGVLNGNILEGVVEIGSPTAPLHLTGTWNLQKNNGLDPKEPYMD